MAGELRPYWQSADGLIKVYHAPCEDVIASVLPASEVALVHADPPYGTGMRSLGNKGGIVGAPRAKTTSRLSGKGASVRVFPPVTGDNKPFDPAPLLALGRPTVMWGANYYSARLPDETGWIFWDKREDFGSDDGSDGELAWSNLGGALRTFRHFWRGALRATEQNDKHLHPTQKPIALSAWIFQRAKLKRGDLVFVPYLGSGPDLPAAQAMGLHVIACDVERWCCDTAISRLGAITADRAAEPCGPLFGAVEPVRK